MSFVTTDEFLVRVTQKLLQGLVSHELTAFLSILAYLNLMNYGHIIKSM